MAKDQAKYKVVVAGDNLAGKTVLLVTFMRQEVLGDYTPTVVESCEIPWKVGGGKATFCLWDTSGTEEFPTLRPLSYPSTDVFLLCFSVDARFQLENAENLWSKEIREHRPDTPVLLVGTNAHLRGDPAKADRLVPHGECEAAAQRIGAVGYVECSPHDVGSITRAFEAAFEECLRRDKAPQGKPPTKSKWFSFKNK